MRIRRNKPTNRREAFASMMWYAPMPGRLEMLPGYGGPEDEIVFLPSTPTVETVAPGTGKPSIQEWIGLGKEVFQLVNGVWTQVRDRQGRPTQQVVSAPPAYVQLAPTNYLPLVLGAVAAVTLIAGAAAFVRSR